MYRNCIKKFFKLFNSFSAIKVERIFFRTRMLNCIKNSRIIYHKKIFWLIRNSRLVREKRVRIAFKKLFKFFNSFSAIEIGKIFCGTSMLNRIKNFRITYHKERFWLIRNLRLVSETCIGIALKIFLSFLIVFLPLKSKESIT